MGNSAYPGSNHEQYGTEDGAQQVPQTFAVQLHGHGYQQRAEHEQSLHTQPSELQSLLFTSVAFDRSTAERSRLTYL